ncbi:tetratricopeptide repeat protein, partial [Candidatus Nomurabacteria bacterium]|nr:tetratricopeptide repeat protein [Candidatus Nomurabacteria bacterium]
TTFSKDQKKLVKLFLTTFIGSATTVLLQAILFLTKGTGFVSKYLGHVSSQGTLVGSWVDFTYFVTFVFLLGLLMYEVLIPKGLFKKFSLGAIILSLVALVFLNFKAAWLVAIFSSLLVFVYKSSVERSLNSRLPKLSQEEEVDSDTSEKQHFPVMSFVSLLIGLLFFLGSSSLGSSASNFAGLSFTDIRPSFSTTNTVMRSALYRDPLFGAGAGSYADSWNMYHGTEINRSIFWNVPFETGFNLLESVVTTNGILPSLAFLAVLILALIHGFKLFNYQFPDRFTRFIAVASLIMTIAIISLFLFGSPGIVLIVFGFTYIGLLFGVSSLVGKTKVLSIDYLKDPRLSFFAILVLVVASMVGFSAVYFTGSRFASAIFYNRALNSQEIASSKAYLDKALNLSNSSLYWKTRTVLYTQEFTNLASTEKPDETELQNLFSQAEQSAQAAIALNNRDASSWLNLSQIYQLVASAGNTEALNSAEQAAIEAQKRSPKNPLFNLNLARIEVLKKNPAEALKQIDLALALKPNYLDAFIFRGQINASQGTSSAVKDELLKYLTIEPRDDQAYILLGNVYIESKNYDLALSALSRAKSLAPNNPNNYLAYITTLDLSGNKAKAIEEFQNFKKLFPRVEGVDEQIERMQKSTKQETSTETPPDNS